MLQEPSSGTTRRSRVAAVLEQMKDPRVVQPLSWALEEGGIPHAAAIALAAIGGTDSIQALERALQHKEWDVHHAAVEALERIRETGIDPSIKVDICAALEKSKKGCTKNSQEDGKTVL